MVYALNLLLNKGTTMKQTTILIKKSTLVLISMLTIITGTAVAKTKEKTQRVYFDTYIHIALDDLIAQDDEPFQKKQETDLIEPWHDAKLGTITTAEF